MTKAWKHFITITRHRHLVMRNCFKVGLIGRGLLHDLSKYSPTEFRVGMRYCTGSRSPNAAERDELGFSTAWMHHKGRNKHHFEYWTDLNVETLSYEAVPMPTKYLVEMVMDRIAACKIYEGSKYTEQSPLQYLYRAKETHLLHPQTLEKLEFLLQMLQKHGEKETFSFIRKTVLKEVPFEQWTKNEEGH